MCGASSGMCAACSGACSGARCALGGALVRWGGGACRRKSSGVRCSSGCVRCVGPCLPPHARVGTERMVPTLLRVLLLRPLLLRLGLLLLLLLLGLLGPLLLLGLPGLGRLTALLGCSSQGRHAERPPDAQQRPQQRRRQPSHGAERLRAHRPEGALCGYGRPLQTGHRKSASAIAPSRRRFHERKQPPASVQASLDARLVRAAGCREPNPRAGVRCGGG